MRGVIRLTLTREGLAWEHKPKRRSHLATHVLESLAHWIEAQALYRMHEPLEVTVTYEWSGDPGERIDATIEGMPNDGASLAALMGALYRLALSERSRGSPARKPPERRP